MSVLPIAQSFYERTDSPTLPLVNMFYEQNPTNQDDQFSAISRPGIGLFFHLPQGPVRGMLSPGGLFGPTLVYAVSGSQLYSTDGSTGLPLGGVSGGDPVRMVVGGTYMVFNAGGVLYSYQTGGTVPAPVALPLPNPVISANYLAGYFLVIQENSQRIYFSAINVPTFDPLDFFSAESSPDFMYAMEVYGDELCLLAPNSVEFQASTGDPDLPFQRIPGRTFSMGVLGKNASTTTPEGIVFIGRDHRVYRVSGAPIVISNPAVEQRLQELANDTYTMWSYSLEGHTMVCINIGQSATLVCDLSTGKWTIFKTRNAERWNICWSAKDAFDRIIVGSSTDGNLYFLDPESTSDNGEQVVCEFSAYRPVTEPERCDSIVLDCSVGIGETLPPDDFPMIEARVSNDRGKTFGPWRARPLGRQGEFRWTVFWSRLGGMMKRPGRLFHFRVAPPSRFTVRQARLNEQP